MRTWLVLGVLLVGAVPAQAQNPDDPTTSLMKVIETLSQRVDALQAKASTGIQAMAWLEMAEIRDYDGKISLGGWAFVCNDPGARVVFVVDDVEVPHGFQAQARPERPDLAAMSTPSCTIALRSGVNGLIDWTVFTPLPARHTDPERRIKIRIYDAHGRSRDSQVKTVTMPGFEGVR